MNQFDTLAAMYGDITQVLQDLFALDSGLETSFERLSQIIRDTAGVESLDIVAILSDTESQVFCKRAAPSACEAQDEAKVLFVRHMTALTAAPLECEALLSRITPEEKALFQYEDMLFVPIVYQNQVFGALFCSRPLDNPLTADERSFISMLCKLAAISFRNAVFYTARLRKERAVTKILENLNTSIFVGKIDTGEILFANKKLRESFDLPDDVVGQACWATTYSDLQKRCECCMTECRHDSCDPYLVWEEHNEKNNRHYKNTDCVMEWLDGSKVHLRHIEDITRDIESQQQLVAAKQLAEQASQAKSDFLSRMSHEIRTPINAIIGLTRIALGAQDMAKTKECLGKIDASSKQLLGIINDILDMSKIEANKMVLAAEPFDFEKMLMGVTNVISVKANERHQKLYIHIDINMPRMFIGDELRLSQVITNLLSNAVKFTPEYGKIRLDVSHWNAAGETPFVEVRVSDTGIGVAKERQGALFSSFEQADGSITRKFGGTGLGLAICRRIVSMMGGTIWVDSEEGKGSVFTFRVPLPRCTQSPAHKPAVTGVGLHQLSVLLVDDAAETRDYFTQIMHNLKIRSRTAASCLEALDLMKQENFNIIFVDWSMPGIDGVDTARLIRQQFGDAAVIVMISVAEWSEIEPSARKIGVSRFVSKPLFPSTLLDTIQEIIGLQERGDTFTEPRHSFSGYTVLVVEDVEINREILSQELAETSINMLYAENGRQAVEMFEASPKKFDLILMDVHMPEMDGYEATRRIRALGCPEAETVPIVAMTANAFAEDVEKSLASGMNDHLTKPVDLEQLYRKMQQYLIRHDRPRDASWPETETARANQGEGGIDMNELQPYVNVEDALGRVRGNKTLYKTLLTSYVNNNHFAELMKQIDGGLLGEAAKTAHAVKGIAANLSLTALYDVSLLAEQQLCNGFLPEETLIRLRETGEKTLSMAQRVLSTL